MTLKLYLALVCAVTISSQLNAQCNNVTLSSQADVNSFQSTYGCTVITGTLTIRGSDIYNLSSLSQITSVGALFITDCPQLFDLGALYNLTNISGSNPESIRIARNTTLNSIDALQNLTSVPGKILIQDNASLRNIDGLRSLTSMSGPGANIYINGNLALENIDGLRSLRTFSAGDIGGVISIAYNPALQNINGLSSLTHLDGGADGMLEILHNESLVNLDGLSSLTQISTDAPSKHAQLKIMENFALTSGCGAYKLLSSNDPNLDVTMSNNGNVTETSIISGGPCQSLGCEGNITLNSQADVDAFPSTHGCSVINGTLEVQGSDITSLGGLSQVTKAARIIIHDNHQLTNLDGLSNLTEVDNIALSGNSLTSLAGLSSLHTVHETLGIGFNDNLRSLHGLENVTTVKDLNITDQSLDDLTGLSGLTSIGSMTLNGNSIQSLNGLGNVTSITRILSITYDSALTSLEGLSGVNTIGVIELLYTKKLQTIGMHSLQTTGPITLLENAALLNLDGLSSLTTIGDLGIDSNPSLQSVQGLASVNTLLSGGITLSNNPKLASLSGFENLAVVAGGIVISNNDALRNLSGLSATSAGIFIVSDNASLESFDGINNLTRITNTNCGCPGAGLKIANNPALTNINALSKLNFIGSSLEISNNPTLQNIDALSSVTHVGHNSEFGEGGIVIGGNTALKSIQGLRNVSGDMAGSVLITDNDALTNLNGLDRLTGTGGNGLVIRDNASLMDIDALSKITQASGGISISNNAMLKNLNGFASLRTISGVKGNLLTLAISNNPMLTNVDSLSRLTSMTGVRNALVVTNNPNLTKGCGLYPVINNTPMTTTFSGNGAGVTKEEILANGPCSGNQSKTCEGGVTLTSQADVDAFPTSHGCTIINGMLSISGNDITDLTPLSDIDSLGSLYITNNANLESLHGLEGIKSIGHTCGCPFPGLVLDNNAKLSDINGLSGLTSNAAVIKITNNPVLTHIFGLSHLTRLGDGVDYAVQSLVIENNPMLNSLEGLLNIYGTVGEIDINNNDLLHNLSGLQNITSIAGYGLSLTGNGSLTDITALSKVKDIGSGVHISDNAMLPNLNGLGSLQRINIVRGGGVAIVVSSNPALVNIDSLSGFTELRGPSTTVDFSNNANLTRGCGLFPLLNDYVQNCPDCQVTYNFSGSGITKEEILANGPCEPGPSTCSGNIALSSQADVDSFQSTHGCSVITGYLTISGADITHLDGLNSVTSVGDLFIDGNPVLKNLDGLDHLTTIAYSPTSGPVMGLLIRNNPQLTNIDGLSSLTSVYHEVRIVNNQSLQNIEGLASLTSIGLNSVTPAYYSVDIEDNVALTTIYGLRNVDDIPGQVFIRNNDALTNLDGLEKTEVYHYGLALDGNDALIDINGLASVQTIAGLAILNNSSLPNVDGLRSLNTITGGATGANVRIINNTSLANVDSLSALVFFAGTPARLTVTDNINLTRGCGFYNMLNISFCDGCMAELTFSNNGAGITKEEILAAGPCEDHEAGPPAPVNLEFSNITDNSMDVDFTASIADGRYITIMRSFESGSPDDGPVDTKTYNVGNVIGCCTIVIGNGPDPHLAPLYLEADVDYYFDIIPYILTNGMPNYFPENALSGHQRTLPQTQPYPNPFMEALVIPVTVTEENSIVNILITDQLGRPVSHIVKTLSNAGKHEITWNRVDNSGNKVMSGVYTYSITTPNGLKKGLVMAK